ncbi:hypothetical protein XELAEV_18028122mg [Xenopus laevis]|uniref:Uncharacterized protein n=1 Tax=Xenopus laevis TaxID=8355 RepID=A0A974HKE1_XENLA|nr:hypothetical protein XELAEV_18028122mg [Xenopus laevis]
MDHMKKSAHASMSWKAGLPWESSWPVPALLPGTYQSNISCLFSANYWYFLSRAPSHDIALLANCVATVAIWLK